MSLESKIQELTETVSRLIDVMNTHQIPIVPPTSASVQGALPVAVHAPLVQPMTIAPAFVTPMNHASSQPAAVAMPAPPTFVAPTPVATAAGAPFSDGKGLINYVMTAYRALGPQKGAHMQNVLTGLGYQNINDVKPEHYGALFAGIEALK